ncbi:hypothetical protein HMPREF1982_04452 [Clostridiales bacterium oral taxon 876 str. F0540]|nr:hypothetical protein HMPREF1982_04452 [Clostridiales bacterium oral taxon 876 str. F0540]
MELQQVDKPKFLCYDIENEKFKLTSFKFTTILSILKKNKNKIAD